jgi:hypothetical protein
MVYILVLPLWALVLVSVLFMYIFLLRVVLFTDTIKLT